MKQKVITIPDDDKRLRQVSKEVKSFDKNLQKLIEDLTETLEAQTDPPGLGLSAPQIGILKRVFVGRIRSKIKGFVNPKILKLSRQEVTILEGCLSVPELYGHVARPAELDLESQDVRGRKSARHYKGLPARIIQHEVDHLNGVLFIDHVHTQNGKMFKVEKDKRGREQLLEVAYA
ncbi:MAG: Peptide deformylase [Candidatus Curtissbacteria bacterium GW2011_GWA1_41_11]|uniref:Peptide deformylase n=1 Tax=Candidatus Curtissbacteria bacterium GW2011_GWA1_41_11 TaxID=1618409 RepID=A0A0G0UGD2_9BACT|nr:MAG: Peptide deformylase [Candidatus Curtissbacteria bacterium GW2011_GWA1_41_11]